MADEGARANSGQVFCTFCAERPATINVDGLASPPFCDACRLFEFDKYHPALEEGRRRHQEQYDRERQVRLAEAEFQRLARLERMRRTWASYEEEPGPFWAGLSVIQPRLPDREPTTARRAPSSAPS